MLNNNTAGVHSGSAAPDKRGRLASRTLYASLDNWSQQAFQLVTFLYVGNVLGPELVGVFATALLYHMFVSNFFVNSFSETIVQGKDITQGHQDAVFYFSVGLGVAAMGLSLLLAPAIAAAFGRREVAGILCALAIIYPMLSVSSFYRELLRRKMQFGRLALRSMFAVGTAAIVAIILVRSGYGVWSLVAYQIWWRTIEFAILLIATDWRPQLRFSMARFREVAHYGFHAMALRLLAYLSSHFDKIVVGLFLGPAPLGIYMLGYRIVMALTQAFTGVCQNIALTVFSRLQSHKRVLRRALSDATRLSNLIGLPVFIGLAIVAKPLVAGLLKPEWLPLVPILQIFCVAGALATVTYIQMAALRALGELSIVFWGNLLLTIVRLGVLLFVAQFGLIPVAVTASLFSIALLPLWQVLLDRRLNSPILGFLANFLPAAWSSAAMAAATLVASELIPDYASSILRLTVMVFVGALAYFTCLRATSPSSVALLKSFLRMRVPQAT